MLGQFCNLINRMSKFCLKPNILKKNYKSRSKEEIISNIFQMTKYQVFISPQRHKKRKWSPSTILNRYLKLWHSLDWKFVNWHTDKYLKSSIRWKYFESIITLWGLYNACDSHLQAVLIYIPTIYVSTNAMCQILKTLPP